MPKQTQAERKNKREFYDKPSKTSTKWRLNPPIKTRSKDLEA